ncbi:hypothetical protein, partial [Mesorhizobium sp.]|uniref:hypothetical protein n=1 Tax=Mesorhizobium sp. TaxID=1871066 RepID=UPI0025BFB4F3
SFSRNSGLKTAVHFSWNCSFFHAIPDGKPQHNFPGIALFFTQFRTENRSTLFLELLIEVEATGPDGKWIDLPRNQRG